MKKRLLLGLLLFGLNLSFAQQNFDMSTLRLGDFTINMTNKAADKIIKSKIKIVNTDNYQPTTVNYLGENVEIVFARSTNDVGDYDGNFTIFSLSTKSKKFRTKSGMGVGSTKDELFEAYKNYANFCVNQSWDEKTQKPSKVNSNFVLTDMDANTMLSFTLRNNVVVEVSVYLNEGC